MRTLTHISLSPQITQAERLKREQQSDEVLFEFH